MIQQIDFAGIDRRQQLAYPQTTDWISGPVDEAAAAAERFQHQRFLDHCLVHSGYYTRRIR
jgi:hypothetical protein